MTGIPKETTRRKIKILISQNFVLLNKKNKEYYWNLLSKHQDDYYKIVANEIDKTNKSIQKLIKSYSTSRLLQEGTRVVIIGDSNVGKSTLFNALLARDRAIVSNKPGTTRDVIEGSVHISNHLITLVDTAGIRSTKEPIEKEGIKKTNLEIKSADLIYQILDPTIKTTAKTPLLDSKTITIFNKEDLLNKRQKNVL